MATTVGQHSVAAFTSPVNGTTPIDANTVRGNDNTVRSAYVDHDADPGIHVQSSTLASRPAAGTAGRKWITNDNDVYTLWFDDGSNWHPVSSENVALTVLATTALTKGDVVKVTGWNNGQDLAEVAKVASASDVAFAVMSADVSINTMGYATNTGLLLDFNTNSFNVGDILYPNTSGGFTATKPTSGNYQPCAYVLRKNSNNGVLYVEFSAPRIVERSDNTASTIVLRDASGNFAAGTITAGAVTSTGLVTFASLKGTGATTVTDILNDSTMATASATTLATSASIKTYVDTKAAAQDTLAEVLANGNTSGANNLIISSGQKIQTGTVAALDGTSAATIADSTGKITISAAPILSALTASQAVFTDASKGLVSNAITGTGNVVMSASPTLTGTIGAANMTLSGTLGVTSTATFTTPLADSNLATISTAGKVSNSATTAASANTASAIVARDASGNFTAGTITAALTGNASTATTLQTARNINGVSFNGSADITVTAAAGTLSGSTLASGVTASSLTSVGTLTSLTVSGDLTVDTSTLKVDSANNRVGVGTASPGTRLHVNQGGDNDGITLANSGRGTSRIEWEMAGSSNEATSFLHNNNTNRYLMLQMARTYLAFSTDNTERMRLDNSGNLAVDTNTLYVDATNNRVGVGTASPGYTLDVQASTGIFRLVSTTGTNAAYLFTQNTGGDFYVGRDNSTGATFGTNSAYSSVLYSGGAYPMVFFTNATERLRLDASGNLGLGVTPSYRMQVYSDNSTAYSSSDFDSARNLVLQNVNTTTNANIGLQFVIGGTSEAAITGIRTAAGETALAFGTRGSGARTEKMRLDASGNLGVGTASPTYRIQAEAAANLLNLYSTTHAAELSIAGTATNVITIAGGTSDAMAFATAATERARITAGGYFKASNAGTYLNATGEYHELRNNTNAPALIASNTDSAMADSVLLVDATRNTTNNTFYAIDYYNRTTTTYRFRVADSGNVTNTNGSYGTISDAKHKTDIVDAGSQWDDMKAIRFRKFKMKSDPSETVMLGVVAQELEQVSPGLVEEHADTEQVEVPVLDEDGNETGEVKTERRPTGTVTKSVKTSVLLMKAAVALQEAMARIEALEARLEALEA